MIIIKWLIYSVAVYFTCWLLPGINVASFWTAVVVAAVLALVNIFIKPILVLLTLPVTIITLGLFLFVINAFLLILTSWFVGGFEIANFWWALLGSLIISAIYDFAIDRLKN
jgi:putative membrane protein